MAERLSVDSRITLGSDSSWLERHPEPSPEVREIATEARAMLLQEPYYEAAEVRELVGGEAVEVLIAHGVLLAYRDHGDLLFPAFQFDPATGQPWGVVSRINRILDAPDDGWGVTAWWIQANGRLPEHTAPKQLLDDPDQHEMLVLLAQGVWW